MKKDPFSFIQEFSGIKLRSKHGTYAFNQVIYCNNNFNIPATWEELTNFTVKYTNGKNFTSEYVVQDLSPYSTNIKLYENIEDNQKFFEYLINYNNKLSHSYSSNVFDSWSFKSLNDIILEFEEKNDVKSDNIFLTQFKSQNKNINAVEWKYTYISLDDNRNVVFQCRIDEDNQINVMKINSFGGTSDSDPSLDIAEKCALLFDENKYRIVIIFPKNGGGNSIVGYNIIRLISPYILTRNTLRIKKDINMDKFIEEYNSVNLFDELNSTNKVKGDYIKDDFIQEKYGDKIEEWSKPFAWRVNQSRIEKIKKNLKYKRKPTEIVVMTDGFAFSAASVFMKNVYKSGAAIVIGYNGNPNLPDDIFDISQSPSGVMNLNGYKNVYPENYEIISKYGIGLASMTCIATFHEFQESHVPEEYDVQIADKRVKIFKLYDDSYYQEFIKEAIEVLDSYQKNCNPNHTMLVLFSEECKFDDNLLHGGYICGNDSKWNTSNCIPVYCDNGYYYNKISNSCIKYPMDEEQDEETEEEAEEETEGETEKESQGKTEKEKKQEKQPDNQNNNVWWIILVSVSGFIILAAVIIFIIFKKRKLVYSQKENKIIDQENALIPM